MIFASQVLPALKCLKSKGVSQQRRKNYDPRPLCWRRSRNKRAWEKAKIGLKSPAFPQDRIEFVSEKCRIESNQNSETMGRSISLAKSPHWKIVAALH